MPTIDESEVSARVDAAAQAFDWLSAEYREWFDAHRIEPRLISLAHDSDGASREDFWLLTDHTGSNDSPYRIVFDPNLSRFGRECLLNTDLPLFLGRYPSLQDALDEV